LRERPIIAVLVTLTALRVAVYSLAFPFFNNVDEQAHADLTIKIARGYWPKQRWEGYDAESIRLFTRHGSPEYLASSEVQAAEPRWKRFRDLPPQVAASIERQHRARWSRLGNHEAHTPPIYYSLAAIGYRAAGWVGLVGIQRLYAARLINVPIVAIFVWLAYRFCRRWYPDRPEIRIGVPLLLAFLPQDVFYSLNTDVLSPLAYTASLMLLLEWHQSKSPSARLGMALGLTVGLTFLVRYTNCVLLLVAGILGLVKLRAMSREGRTATGVRTTSIVALSATAPVAILFLRNAIFLGDFSGTRAKLEMQGSAWTVNTLGGVLGHPIFTFEGLSTFWHALISTLWRGEVVWYSQPVAHEWMDGFYSLSTAALWLVVTAAWVMAWARARRGATSQAGARSRLSTLQAVIWVSPLLAILTLVVLSLTWDFGDFFFPSREHPFFTQGRLIAGQLVPLMILYVEGIAVLVRRFSAATGTIIIVALIAGAMLVSETTATAPVFSSAWNWFHVR
jgi:hypothetical protein